MKLPHCGHSIKSRTSRVRAETRRRIGKSVKSPGVTYRSMFALVRGAEAVGTEEGGGALYAGFSSYLSDSGGGGTGVVGILVGYP